MNQQSIHDRIMSRNQGKGAVRVGIEDRSRPQRNRAKTAVFSLLAIAVVATAGFAAMRYDLLHNLLPQPAVAETNQPNPALAETPFLQHAKEAGLQSCSNIFPALGQMLTTGTTYSVQSIWNNEAPDKHLVEALVGMNYATQGYSGPAAGLVFAAPTASVCEGTMVRVAPFAANCADVPALLPKDSKLANNLGQISVYELANGGGNAMLLPTGNSCVVISVASAAGKQGGVQ
ncbi:hypothetical protein X769_16195 [Mesorhizobium sp. LSJC268A00]|uniref:hypothetical protein n=1 Tax=unclassified Mesorhizobium TaxID=325217 RepID=UPI0003CE1601|nr:MULTISPECIES: hypothetical protein [unclassified Mesorhizobium]ESW92285.1 hypothetical protein X770_07900 [Mesorhizobium sp. LSJC269B00]ESX03760.1 hypothetical protein X769_16195 [Mesorhizobium sp. LSJC268A00]ESX93151.1 hypothetical protein X755_25015 [Mesorhizobium sp. LNJC405B00]ESZ10555.1 hypothetical protein X735_28725 [Mesorhizobium sp. L2C085B000]